MYGCKSKSQAMLHLHFTHDADAAQDSSTKERNARSVGKRFAWIPAYFTSNTCMLKLLICTVGTSYLDFWRLGSWGATREG